MGAASLDVDGDLPPSAKFVAHVLDREGDLTVSELREETGLNEGTVRRALAALEETGAVEKDADPRDLRRRVCRYVPSSERRLSQ